jgi:hypothetical protein
MTPEDAKHAPWYIVRSDDKRRGRLNCLAQLLDLIPYKEAPRQKIKLPAQTDQGRYDHRAPLDGRTFAPQRYRPAQAQRTACLFF